MSAASAIRRCTKLVATVGPASGSPEMVRSMIDAGVDVFRLNFSHGGYAEHRERVDVIRGAAGDAGRHVAILQDLCGPKIRTTANKDNAVIKLATGAKCTIISSKDVAGHVDDAGCAVLGSVYEDLATDVGPGDPLLLSDGNLSVKCESVDGNKIICSVVHGGKLKSSQGINLPTVDVSAPAITDKDVADLEFGLENGVDFVAVSFVRQAADLQLVRNHMDRIGRAVPLIAKMERPQALSNLDELLAEADGMMVARGDLGVELPPYEVPIAQKRIIAECNKAGIPVIVATQMLESMITMPRPTRAEVSDVTNAIFDGADACMLSGESAVGDFPLLAVEMMAQIAEYTHMHSEMDTAIVQQQGNMKYSTPSECIGSAAVHLARNVHAKAIVAFTHTGKSALDVARSRPDSSCPVIALADTEATCRRMALTRGVHCFQVPIITTAMEATMVAEQVLLDRELVKAGDRVVIAGGHPVTAYFAPTNYMKVHTIGSV